MGIVFLCFGNYKVGGESKHNIMIPLGVIFIIFFSAIRFDIGWDYPSYYYMVFPSLDNEALERMEPLCQLIIKSSYLFGYPPLMFMLFSLFTYGLVGYTIVRHSSNIYISFLIYLTFFYLSSLSIIRQGLAVSVILFALPLLYRKRYLQFGIVSICSCFIHFSSIITLLFIPIYIFTDKKTFWIILTIAFCSMLSLNILVERIFPGYYSYIENADNYKGGNLMKILMILIVAVVCIGSFKTKDRRLIKMACIGIIGSLFPFFLGEHIGGRVSMYFFIPLIYFLPQALSLIKIKNIKCIAIIILNFIFLLNLYVDSQNPIKSSLTPYQTVFSVDVNNPKFK